MLRRLNLIILAVCLFVLPKIEVTSSYLSDNEVVGTNNVAVSCWESPSAPLVIAPVDSLAINYQPTFSWSPSTTYCGGAMSYFWEIYSDSSFINKIADSGWTNNTTYSFSLNDGTYFWRVMSKDSLGNESYYVQAQFTLDRGKPLLPQLSVSKTWTKVVEEKVTNDWITVGDVSPETSGFKIGREVDDGNYVWENRLMQSIEGGAKSLTLRYDFHSLDSYDDPGFLIKLNGQEAIRLTSLDANIGWVDWNYDLTSYSAGQKINLAIYAGNNGGKQFQSWAYVKDITTYFVAAPGDAQYNIFCGDPSPSSGVYCQYKIDSGDWITGTTFSGLLDGNHTIYYQGYDAAGNYSDVREVKVITDSISPPAIDSSVDYIGLLATAVSANTISLTWTAPGEASKYDIRYSLSPIDNSNFDFATKAENVPSPQKAGTAESLNITGLNPSTTYYFAIKSYDSATNVSGISNIASDTTLIGSPVNPGDIVINELMWSGTSASSSDQFVELRNMTSLDMDLSGLVLKDWEGSVTIPLSGTVSANGYFVISSGTPTNLKNTVDLTDSSLVLSNTALQIKLETSSGDTIDIAWDQTKPTEGLVDSGKYYSMERTNVAGNGADPLSWYTCIDENSHADFFTGTADERGTPGAANRSENEPIIPEPILKLSVSSQSATFIVANTKGSRSISYELTYDSALAPQGAVGTVDLDPADNIYEKTIILGSCSTGGKCVYYEGVNNFKLKVILDGIKTLMLQ